MSQDQALQFLQQGIAAAKARQNEQARQLLQNAIRLDPGNETAWLWLSSVAKDKQERIFCLKQLLQINPQNEMAIKGLRNLGVGAEPEAVAAVPKSTVPQPTAEQIAAAQAAVDPLLQRLMTPQDPYAHIAWTHKDRRRAGERAATLFKLGIRVAPLLLLICLLTPVAIFISTHPGAIALVPTLTPSRTPTNTATPTPGFTPTPSPTPVLTYTPSPTLDPALPAGSLDVEMTPTPIYPNVGLGANPLRAAVVAMDRGEYSAVLPTLVAERENTSALFNANPYFYEALALTELGDTERALRTLQEAMGRLGELREQERAKPGALLQTGLAYVYAAMGEYGDSNAAAEEALQADPDLHLPHIILVRNALATNDLSLAAQAIGDGLLEHPSDVNLWILRGDLNLRLGQAPEAQQDARVALHIDPTAEEAYLLQARADTATGDYGLAVLHLQSYLFIYPGSIKGWTALGDARRLEGNLDLAIEAYSRAVNTEDRLPSQIPAYMARAELYLQRHQFARAQADYGTVLNIDDAYLPAREGRAQAAYRAAHFGEAIADLNELIDQLPERNDLRLLKAQALVDGANPVNEEAYRQALDNAFSILSGNFPGTLEGNLKATAYEYRARILFARESYRDALHDIDLALAESESGSRHFWRGRIEQAQNNLEEARREFEWVRLWGSVYSYPFLPDAIQALDAMNASAG